MTQEERTRMHAALDAYADKKIYPLSGNEQLTFKEAWEIAVKEEREQCAARLFGRVDLTRNEIKYMLDPTEN